MKLSMWPLIEKSLPTSDLEAENHFDPCHTLAQDTSIELISRRRGTIELSLLTALSEIPTLIVSLNYHSQYVGRFQELSEVLITVLDMAKAINSEDEDHAWLIFGMLWN